MPDDVFRWVIAGAVILACLAIIVQAIVVILLYRVARNTQTKVAPLMDRAEPILAATRQILEQNKPRIAEISAEAVEIAKTARVQVDRISDLLTDGSDRAKARMAQIDRTVDETVEQVEQVGGAVKGAVLKPVREVNGLMAGMKAAISTYAAGNRRPSVEHATQDEEMFI
jgi:hypothetical protein